MKKEKGITLVALIITIIVLLILAVVTISAINEGTLFAHANNAAKSYIAEADLENEKIAYYSEKMNNIENEKTEENEENVIYFCEDTILVKNSNYIKSISIDLNDTSELQKEVIVAILEEEGGAYKINPTENKISINILNYSGCYVLDENNYINLKEKVYLGQVRGNVTQFNNVKLGCLKCYITNDVEIPYRWFRNTIGMALGEEVILESGITEIPNEAFQDADIIKTMTIPSSVTSIGYNAFYAASNLQLINVPNNTIKELVINAGYSGTINVDNNIN